MKENVSLVLSGGGARGIVHIGAIEELGYFNLINKTVGLLTYQIAKMTIEKYPPGILINISRKSCGVFDFYKAEELVEIGQNAAIKNLKEYNNKVY